MALARRWETVACDLASAHRLAGELDLPRPLGVVLARRGIADRAAAERFLASRLSDLSDPCALADMEAAVARIEQAIAGGERIAVFGDYDADGVTATALLVSVFRALGADAAWALPSRFEEGYGLTVGALERCLERCRPGLVVTADCGTCSAEAVQCAAAAGVDVVVTDHHAVSGELAPAAAVVNPKRGGSPSLHVLAGVGVAFKLCHALVKHRLATGREASVRHLDLREYLDLVAIGTVADVVPLTGENRILVHHGLQRLSATPSPGLAALRRVAGVKGRVRSHHVGFALGPRLNAAGRLGSAEAALEMLLAPDEASAMDLARGLDAANRERREIEEGTFDEAVREIDGGAAAAQARGLVVGRDGWHVGTVGIVAARLVGRYYRPALVVAFEAGDPVGRGSGRSVAGVDLVAALASCADLLESYGGHAMAAGLKVRRERLPALRERFDAWCAGAMGADPPGPVHRVDAWIELGEVDEALFAGIERLAPFGMGNAAPLWGARHVVSAARPRVVGRDHLRLSLASGPRQVDAIAFGMAGREVPPGPLDVLFQVKEDTYGGRRSLQLSLRDFRPAGDGG